MLFCVELREVVIINIRFMKGIRLYVLYWFVRFLGLLYLFRVIRVIGKVLRYFGNCRCCCCCSSLCRWRCFIFAVLVVVVVPVSVIDVIVVLLAVATFVVSSIQPQL